MRILIVMVTLFLILIGLAYLSHKEDSKSSFVRMDCFRFGPCVPY